MSSWCVDVKCKEKYKDPKSTASLSHPMMDDFDYTSDIKYIENIEDFIERFAVHYVVLNVDLYNELLLLVKVADDHIKQKPFLYSVSFDVPIRVYIHVGFIQEHMVMSFFDHYKCDRDWDCNQRYIHSFLKE